MPVDICAIKKELRTATLARRSALTQDEVAAHSARIAERVVSLPIFTGAEVVAGYMAMRQEVETRAILQAALDQGKRVVLPRTLLQERILVLHAVSDIDQLVTSTYGIQEPTPDTPVVDPAEVDLFLVPGAVFDAAGHRIGYGAGLYDTLLVEHKGWRVALAHALQLVPEVPTAAHDMLMDLIVTEVGIIDCAQGRQACDHLRMRNMVFYGHHGAFPQEREQGIRLAVDVDLQLDLQVPGLTDDLATTVNYPAVYRLIERIQSQREFSLFEALVEHIASAILADFPTVREVTVTARKFHPPVGGLLDAFEVAITRARPAWLQTCGG